VLWGSQTGENAQATKFSFITIEYTFDNPEKSDMAVAESAVSGPAGMN